MAIAIASYNRHGARARSAQVASGTRTTNAFELSRADEERIIVDE